MQDLVARQTRQPPYHRRVVTCVTRAAGLAFAITLCVMPASAHVDIHPEASNAPAGHTPSTFTGGVAHDVVRLRNGDELFGEILSDDGVSDLIFVHPDLGTLTLPRRSVADVRPASAARVLDGSDPLPQAGPGEDRIVQGEPRTDSSTGQGPSISAIAPSPSPTVQAAKDAPVPKAGLFGTPILRGFDKRLDVGFSGSGGNSDVLNLYSRFDAKFEDDDHRWLIDSAYFYTQNNGQTKRSEGRLGVTRDWLPGESKWFYFARTRYDFDDFKSWRHRVSFFAGPGYEFVRNERFTLVGRVGVGLTQEFGGPNPDDLRPEGLAGLEGSWKIDERQSITASTTLFPLLDEFGEFRNVTSAAYSLRLSHHVSLKLGLENEYESRTPDDSEHNDVKYFGAIVVEF